MFARRHEVNLLDLKNQPFGGRAEEILGAEAFAKAKREITSWPGYALTPLVPLAGMAGAFSHVLKQAAEL